MCQLLLSELDNISNILSMIKKRLEESSSRDVLEFLEGLIFYANGIYEAADMIYHKARSPTAKEISSKALQIKELAEELKRKISAKYWS